MTKLSVNVNKIALLRNTRALGIPDVEKFARIALDAGAHGITIHPRPDGRHIRADDVSRLATLMQAYPGREFNIEGNPFHNLLDFVRETRPDQCTLVPDEAGQFTSDHGWDIAKDGVRLRPIIDELRSLGVRVSLFMDPLPAVMPQVKALGADRIELYTEPYAATFGQPAGRVTLDAYVAAAAAAISADLGVNAGHDLNLHNLRHFVAALPALLEVSIGHALVADALEFGLAKTVHLYLEATGNVPLDAA
ncbi:MAG: pyridoxine 5'-phosphate synthase [Burkholderiales bacterium]